jgi:SAM-dependent methyltransferase
VEVLVGKVEGARTFGVAGTSYDSFMGRYSLPLAKQFADAAGVAAGQTAVDVGCGPGALTGELVARLGAASVYACDPSPPFCDECASRYPGIVVKQGRAEKIPFETQVADLAMAQLVLHFVSKPEAAAREMARVVRPGGSVAACVWDFDGGMEMLRAFWDAALSIDPDAPDEARMLRFGRPGEIAELFAAAQLVHIEESTLSVASSYSSFDELWNGFMAGVGPAGSYCVSLSDGERDRLRGVLFTRLGSPSGSFTLGAVARCAVGRAPG